MHFRLYAADAAILTNDELVPNASGEITGSQFGTLSDGSFVCFNINTKCFNKDSFAQKGFEWSDGKIIFGVPGDIPISGSIMVYNIGKKSVCAGTRCTIQDTVLELARLSYRIKPLVRSVNPLMWSRNGDVVIRGAGFGEATGVVLFDDLTASATQWSDKEINVRAPADGIVKRITIQSPNGTRAFFDVFSYLDQIQTPRAWSLLGDGKVTVAVIDDGVYLNHPALKSFIWKNPKEQPGNAKDDDGNGYIDDVYGYNFIKETASVDPNGSHGTRVASIILSTAQSGMAGNRSSISIMPLVVADSQGTIPSKESVIKAIKYAADNGADIINASFGSGGTIGYASEYDSAIQYAFDRGSIVVAAAGNDDQLSKDGADLNVVPQSPVCNNKRRLLLLGVAALDNTDASSDGSARARWSSYGSNCVSIAAPGVRIPGAVPPQYSVDRNSYYEQSSGTSFATPIVAGVAAMMKATYPMMPHWEIMNRIIGSADSVEAANRGSEHAIGGKVNAFRALSASGMETSIGAVEPLQVSPGEKVRITIRQHTSKNILRLFNERTAIPLSPSSITPLAADTFEVIVPQDVAKDSYRFAVVSESGTQLAASDMRLELFASAPPPPVQIQEPIQPIQIQPPIVTQPMSEVSFLSPASPIDAVFSLKMKGRILLQVEEQGRAWYVNPADAKRYYLRDGRAAFDLLRRFGLGIRATDLATLPKEGSKVLQQSALQKRLKGKIVLDIQGHGEAWYINPKDGLRYYLKNGEEAYRIMRQLSLGISNANIGKITIGQ